MVRYIFISITILFWPLWATASWDFSNPLIRVDHIMGGGPPKDGIPSLTDPKVVSAGEVDFLKDDEEVLGLVHKGEPRAYPLRLLSWHELINDSVAGDPLLVSW